jgi:hypothetical protein
LGIPRASPIALSSGSFNSVISGELAIKNAKNDRKKRDLT